MSMILFLFSVFCLLIAFLYLLYQFFANLFLNVERKKLIKVFRYAIYTAPMCLILLLAVFLLKNGVLRNIY